MQSIKRFIGASRLAILGAAVLVLSCANPAGRQGADSARVLIIGVDALSPDGIRTARTPHLDSLMAAGAHSLAARAVLTTSSSQNWASMIMGAGPEQHGINSNAWEPDHFSIAPTVTGVGSIFPSIFDLLHEQRPGSVSASIYDWGGFGRLYNRSAVSVDVDADGPQDAANVAVRVFRENAPTVTFVHLDHVDLAGHRHGHGTPEFYASVEEADTYIGEIMAGLEAAGLRETTTVIVSADHGGKDFGHGGESMAEVEIPWIISGPGVTAGTAITDPINTFDTAVTAAYVLGLDVPYAWIGRPVYAAFTEPDRPEPVMPGIEGVEHVVVIGVDGLSPDGVQKAHAPVMSRLLAGGAFSLHARAVRTTSSSQNWASMIMGAGPVQHGITSNDWERDNFSIVPTVKGPEDLFPSMFSELRAAEPDAYIASIYDWGGFGRLFPNSVVDVDIDADGPQDAAEEARAHILEHRPRLSFIHLDHVDHALHTYGHGSDEYYASVEEADRLIGTIMQALDDAGIAERTLVIISSDHGGLGKGHGGDSMAELEIPWIVHGPGVVQGKQLQVPINIFDTAATVLFALGLQQPYAWIARPVLSAFDRFHDPSESLGVYVPAPRIKPLGGLALLEAPVEVSMSVNDAGAQIRYTLDGSEPTDASSLYEGPIRVSESAEVQARSFRDGGHSLDSRAQFRMLQPGQQKNVAYSYYEGQWAVLPNFDELQPVRTGMAYEFHLQDVESRREDHFAVRFEGIIQADQSGTYTFYTRSDDGTKLYVDGTQVVDNDGSHGPLEESGEIDLEPGMHTIVVEYFEDYGGEHLEVLLRGPGVELQHLTHELIQPR